MWNRSSTAFLACTCYALCSITLTIANKYIFSHELNCPWTLLGIQSFFVVIMLITFQVLRGASTLSLPLMRQMFLPCTLFTVFIFSNSQALRFVSLPVLSVMKSLAPLGIALIELAMFGDTISGGTAVSMCLIIVGNAVTMVNDMDHSIKGFVWAIGNVLFNIGYVVSLRVCLSNKYSPIQKAIHSNMTAAMIMLPISYAGGETLSFLKAIKEIDISFLLVYIISCFLAATIGASVFWVVQTSSGSTLSFVGSCNKFLVVILGGLLFKTHITQFGWISIAFGLFAGVLFTVSKTRDGTLSSCKNFEQKEQVGDKQVGSPAKLRADETYDTSNLTAIQKTFPPEA